MTSLYDQLEQLPKVVRRRATARLQRLRGLLTTQVPQRTLDETLLLATWNIREFDSAKYGARCAEAFFYIAEIVSRFDLVAVQEVREDLGALERLCALLGGWWHYVVTDVTAGTPGNGERLAFLYDSRKVVFDGLAGELVLPQPARGQVLQFARTPFVCGFRAGWSAFSLCTVHIYYGTAKKDDPRRVAEIRELATTLAKRARLEKRRSPSKVKAGAAAPAKPPPENLIVLGDFNIFGRGDVTMQALLDAGFVVPPGLDGEGVAGTSLGHDHHYDQIAIVPQPRRLAATERGGVLNYYDAVFREDEERTYAATMGEPHRKKLAGKDGKAAAARYYKDWRTFQMSDHLVLWAELRIGWADEALAEVG